MTWIPLTRETAGATQGAICDLLGLSRATFNASAFLAQGNASVFPEASPADRKALLGSILDPHELWPRLAARAKAEAKEIEAALAADSARISDREQVAGTLHGSELELTDAREKASYAGQVAVYADEALEKAQAALAANHAAYVVERAAAEAKLTANRERDHAAQEQTRAGIDAEHLPNLRAQLAGQTNIAATGPGLEEKVAAQHQAKREYEVATLKKAEAQAAVVRQRELLARLEREIVTDEATATATLNRIAHLNAAEDGTERCGECKQLLGSEARVEVIQTLDEKCSAIAGRLKTKYEEKAYSEAVLPALLAAETTITVPEVPTEDYTADLAAARQAAVSQAALAVQIAGCEAEAAKLPALTAERAVAELALEQRTAEHLAARAAVADNAALEQSVADARHEVILARSTLEGANGQVVRAEDAVQRATQAATDLAALRAATAERQTQLDTLRLAERAYGRDGIPALIAENAIPQLEAEANRILERLPTSNGTTFRVEMRTQRALKSADGLKETLDILVSDRTTTREFLTYSGGERFRVSFALRWALAKMLAGRRGAESRLLVIDEPDGLDAGGMDGLAAVLRDEASSFSRVLLVSHNPLLASAFEQVVELASDGDVSRIVGAGTAVVV